MLNYPSLEYIFSNTRRDINLHFLYLKGRTFVFVLLEGMLIMLYFAKNLI